VYKKSTHLILDPGMPQGTRKSKAASLPAVLLSDEERKQLKEAYCKLEHPSLAARLSNVVGTPIEIAFQLMPKDWADRLHGTTHRSITRALDVAINTLHDEHNGSAKDHYHKVLSTATGAAGGFFGLPALFVELPVTTTLMLRSIADIARTYGEDLEDPEVRLSCIGVFAMGARTDEDDAAETGYYGVRLAMSVTMASARHQILTNGIAEAPWFIKLITMIASRFGIAVQEKAAAQMVPVIGALGGAFVNTVFMQHFQETAHAHFLLRRMERKYGMDLIQQEYEKLAQDEALQRK
jgi:hypothetical protein